MTWDKGAAEISEMVADGLLQEVPSSVEAAQALLTEARRHLASADLLADTDPQGAYSLLYDAARKGLAAVLQAEGLRATAKGGHVVLQDAMRAQFDPPLGHLFRPFGRMRQRRNQSEYASTDNPEVTAEEVRSDLTKAIALLDDFCVRAVDLVS
ncbi:hypothetical protein [Phycicoccus sonneratiae]|uniref:HEPN domain-containing protein n=1 Tax=Phycicoccus sonneratiae TaxID=2807628 RepID=A0ABS2CML2_9MICO|nr:hypothetical protein [Phycicoccus sonneraticus]MBM6401117.1 hypothetical protein [Phycicoccus sonneraticus]